MADWCTVESDPAVFTELIEKFGVEDVQVEEVYDLESAADRLDPIYGYIFLFKWQPDNRTGLTILEDIPGVFFAKQMIQNACGTQAIINMLMNREDAVNIGQTLKEFKSFTTGFRSEDTGAALANAETIKKAHNSFRRNDPFTIESVEGGEKEDAFHFISYVPNNGVLYELDGLQRGPIAHGECTNENWLQKVKPIIQQRMDSYAGNEVRFTLLAVCKKLKTKYEEQLAQTEDQNLRAELQAKIAEEDDKHAKWKKANTRRKHNYVPFICALLKGVARNGLMDSLVETAKERKKEKVSAMEARKKEEDVQSK